MKALAPSWLLLVYLAIDLANPFVPGAFQFTPEHGVVWVEATSHAREGVDADGVAGHRADHAPGRSRDITGDDLRVAGAVRDGRLTAWLAGVRTNDPPARDFPPVDSDDH